MRIVVASALLGVGMLAHSPACTQPLYRTKQETQEKTQEVFSVFDAHRTDDDTRHLPLATAYAIMATGASAAP